MQCRINTILWTISLASMDIFRHDYLIDLTVRAIYSAVTAMFSILHSCLTTIARTARCYTAYYQLWAGSDNKNSLTLQVCDWMAKVTMVIIMYVSNYLNHHFQRL